MEKINLNNLKEHIYNFNSGKKIPEEAQYTSLKETGFPEILEKFPEEPKAGDVFIFGDYSYLYRNFATGAGWDVKFIDSGTKPGEILEVIAGKPVVAMTSCFENRIIKNSPKIPDTVQYMKDTFSGCVLLEEFPELPKGLISLKGCFKRCGSVKNYVGSDERKYCFAHYKIPESVIDMRSAFEGCDNIRKAPAFPSKVIDIGNAYKSCNNLECFDIIPESVESMKGCFILCEHLSGYIKVNKNFSNKEISEAFLRAGDFGDGIVLKFRSSEQDELPKDFDNENLSCIME